jgi:small subunit ribosomal protein S16
LSVKIRLRRTGKKKQPMFRFVATDSRMPRDGRFLEVLGWYRPLEKPAKLKIDVNRTVEWLKQGAVPSDTVASLFRQCGMMQIWQKAKAGEDITGLEVKDAIRERPHKVKSKARARMVEAEKKAAEDAPAEEKAEAPAEAVAEESAEAPAEEKTEAKE